MVWDVEENWSLNASDFFYFFLKYIIEVYIFEVIEVELQFTMLC